MGTRTAPLTPAPHADSRAELTRPIAVDLASVAGLQLAVEMGYPFALSCWRQRRRFSDLSFRDHIGARGATHRPILGYQPRGLASTFCVKTLAFILCLTVACGVVRWRAP
jgi:hypothetical protein